MENRYSRQEVLKLIGKQGQEHLLDSAVAVVGCGALGSVAAELLARAGIGSLILIDHDVVDITNLQRQSLYTEKDLSKPKASCLKQHLKKINSNVKITAYDINLNFENINKVLKADLILDCTDNIDTRLLINEFCVKNKLVWIHSAAVQEKGIVLNFFPNKPCFKCAFPLISEAGSCEELGILNSTSHMTASMQVVEAIKVLTKKDAETYLIRINAWNHSIEKIKVKSDPKCPVCNGKYDLLQGKIPDFTAKQCKTRKGWSVKPKHNLKLNLKKIKDKFKIVLYSDIVLVIDYEGEIIVHNYGELLFKDLKNEKRIKQITEEIYRVGQK